jgi:predicted O-methyltransferase YrrM
MPKWYQRSTPAAVPSVPWLSPQAVSYLESILQPEFRVIEHGSGGSTLWFAKRVKEVIAYERDVNWFSVLDACKPENVKIRNSDKPAKYSNKTFDLLLIDGEPVTDRAAWLERAPKIVKAGGWVVLDNANRPEYELARAEFGEFAKLIYTADANEPGTRYLVTEFWQCE